MQNTQERFAETFPCWNFKFLSQNKMAAIWILNLHLFFVCKLPGGAILVCDKNLKFQHGNVFANLSWVFCKRNFSILKKTVGGDRFPVTVYFENWPGNPVNWQPCRNIFLRFWPLLDPNERFITKKHGVIAVNQNLVIDGGYP